MFFYFRLIFPKTPIQAGSQNSLMNSADQTIFLLINTHY